MIKILLVDDNLTFLTAVRKFLAMLPDALVIAEAHDGRQALAQAAQWRPDLVLHELGRWVLSAALTLGSVKVSINDNPSHA